MSDFDRALAITLRFEGGYADNPADPGGKTMKGITQRTYDAYRRSIGKPVQWVKNISDDEVAALYLRDYWSPVAPGRINPLNITLFDAAVNSGVKNALWMLEQAKAQHPEIPLEDPRRQLKLALAVLDVREQFFRNIVKRRPTSAQFLHGWLRRCDILRGVCVPRMGLVNLPDEGDLTTPRTDDLDAAELHNAAD